MVLLAKLEMLIRKSQEGEKESRRDMIKTKGTRRKEGNIRETSRREKNILENEKSAGGKKRK